MTGAVLVLAALGLLMVGAGVILPFAIIARNLDDALWDGD